MVPRKFWGLSPWGGDWGGGVGGLPLHHLPPLFWLTPSPLWGWWNEKIFRRRRAVDVFCWKISGLLVTIVLLKKSEKITSGMVLFWFEFLLFTSWYAILDANIISICEKFCIHMKFVVRNVIKFMIRIEFKLQLFLQFQIFIAFRQSAVRRDNRHSMAVKGGSNCSLPTCLPLT